MSNNIIEVLYEDNHLLVINKKISDIVQGDKTGDESLVDKLKHYLKVKYKKEGNVFLGVVHRLDRPVSGAIIYAKTGKALTRLNKMFQEKDIQKIYWAVVGEQPAELDATLTHHLVRKSASNKSYAYDKAVKNSKKATLSYSVVGMSKKYYYLEVELHTGRHHQIRSQLAKIGCPIKGDLKYGFKRSNENGGIHLHARKISFIHPVKKERITVLAPPPKDILWDEFPK